MNSKALSSNITLNASDIGLGNVTNDTQLKSSQLDTDGTLTANSDTKIASQKAVKTYVDTNHSITGMIVAGENVLLSGAGTTVSPYNISSTGLPYNNFPLYSSNGPANLMSSPFGQVSGNPSTTIGSSMHGFSPLPINRACKLNTLRTLVSTDGTGTIYVGIYKATNDGLPFGDLLYQGSNSPVSGMGHVNFTTNLALQPGLYWVLFGYYNYTIAPKVALWRTDGRAGFFPLNAYAYNNSSMISIPGIFTPPLPNPITTLFINNDRITPWFAGTFTSI